MATKDLKRQKKILYVVAFNTAVQCCLGITCLILLYCYGGPFNSASEGVEPRNVITEVFSVTENNTTSTPTANVAAPLIGGTFIAAHLNAETSTLSGVSDNVTEDPNSSKDEPTVASSVSRFFNEINGRAISYAGLSSYKVWFGLCMCMEGFWLLSVIGLFASAYSVPNNFKYILPWIFVTAGVCVFDIGWTIFFIQALITGGNIHFETATKAGVFEEVLILLFIPIFCCKCGIYWIINIVCLLKVKNCYVWLKKYYENPFGEPVPKTTYEIKRFVENDKFEPPKNINGARRKNSSEPTAPPSEVNTYSEPQRYPSERDNYSQNPPKYPAERQSYPLNRPPYASERGHPAERQVYPSSRPKYPSERQRPPSERDNYPLSRQIYPPEPARYIPNANEYEPKYKYPPAPTNFASKYPSNGYTNEGFIDEVHPKPWSYTPNGRNEPIKNLQHEPQKLYRPPSQVDDFEDPRREPSQSDQLEPVHPISKPKSKTPVNSKPKAGILKKKPKQSKSPPPEDDDIPENSRVPENKFKKKPTKYQKADKPNQQRRNTGYYPEGDMVIRNPIMEQLNRNLAEERWEPNDPVFETVEEKWEPRVPTFSYIKDLPEENFSIPRTQLRTGR